MRNYFLLLMGLGIFISAAQADMGGLSVSPTRIIYHAGDNSAEITIFNGAMHTPYLIELSLTDAGESLASGRYVMPSPVVPLPPQERRVIRIGDIPDVTRALPADRESLSYLWVRGVPGMGEGNQKGPDVGGEIHIALTMKVKVIYRPNAVEKASFSYPDVLTATCDAAGLHMHNSSPRYIALAYLKTRDNAVPLNNDEYLLSPFSDRVWRGACGKHVIARSGDRPDEISWGVIKDSGQVITLQSVSGRTSITGA